MDFLNGNFVGHKLSGILLQFPLDIGLWMYFWNVIFIFCVFTHTSFAEFLLVQVALITATLPYVLITVILIRGCTLPGASDGIYYYLRPNISKLIEAEVSWCLKHPRVIQSFFNSMTLWLSERLYLRCSYQKGWIWLWTWATNATVSKTYEGVVVEDFQRTIMIFLSVSQIAFQVKSFVK